MSETPCFTKDFISKGLSLARNTQTMLSASISRLYHPKNPSLGLVVVFAKFFGIWYPNRSFLKTITLYIFVTFDVIYLFGVFLTLCMNFTYENLFTFIQYSSFYLNMHKIITFIMHHKKWEVYVEKIGAIENEAIADKKSEHAKVVYEYKKKIHRFTVLYSAPIYGMLVIFLSIFFLQNTVMPDFTGSTETRSIFIIWLPFDDSTRFGRYISNLMQIIVVASTSVFCITFDAFMLGSMIFLAGQVKTIRKRCAHALDSEDESWKNLIKCHQHFLAVSSARKELMSLIKTVTFIHILQVSAVCGVSVSKIVLEDNSMPELIWTIDFLTGVNFQLFVFYNIANEIIIESEELCDGVFESDWVTAEPSVRRGVVTLAIGMRKRLSFTAGPFNEMSLATLLSILKGVYSLYTVLQQTK